MKIQFDYRFDTNNFFNTPQKKAALEKAGEIWSSLLQDNFEPIPVGAEFNIINPTTEAKEKIVLNQAIDDVLIFVGANNFGNQSNQLVTDGTLAEARIDGLDLQGDIFQRRVSKNFRDQGIVSNFEPWAGTITFNNKIDWNFSVDNINYNKIDLVTVALHEIGHVLGIGTSNIFKSIAAGAKFDGVNALKVNNNNPIPLELNLDHVQEGFNQNTVLLDPVTNLGRNLPSRIDLALLADIGYQINGYISQGKTPLLATDKAENIFGSILADQFSGLSGNDTINGNKGKDTLYGGEGLDIIFGQEDADSLFGEAGADEIQGGAGNDLLSGGDGNDLLFGGDGNDTLSGNNDNDELQGGEQQDYLWGNAGNDKLFGDNGNDKLFGDNGNDYLIGGNDNDSLNGGSGDDTLFGEAGEDQFQFDRNSGKDIITNFTVADDLIVVSNEYGFTTGEEVFKKVSKVGSTTNGGFFSKLVFDSNNQINIYHDKALSAANFDVDIPLQVKTFNPTNSGFVVKFNQAIDLRVLNLYDGQDRNQDLSDLSLVSKTTGKRVQGSLVWNAQNNTLTFVKTGGTLTPDDYTLTLASRADSFINNKQQWLDGDLDRQSGGDVVKQFTIKNNDKRILSLDDFSLSPGQKINLDDDNFGWAISLDDASNLTQVNFTLNYDSALLSVTDFVLNPDLPDDWQIVNTNFSSPGQASVSFEGSSPLTKDEIDLVFLQGQIKPTAVNGKSGLLDLTSITLNHGAIDVIGDSAVLQLTTLGDSSGNGSYSGLDASLISRVAAGLDTGFDAYSLTDPRAIADLNQDGVISALDASLVAQQANGI